MNTVNKNQKICRTAIRLCGRSEKLLGWRLVRCANKVVRTIGRYWEGDDAHERPKNFKEMLLALKKLDLSIKEYAHENYSRVFGDHLGRQISEELFFLQVQIEMFITKFEEALNF